MRLRALAAIAVLFLAGSPSLRAGDATVWSALVLATNHPTPHEPPPELESIAAKLKNVFGYNQFDVIGSHEEKMDSKQERWLIPSKTFFLHVSSQKKAADDYLVQLQLYQDKRMLVDMKTKLGSQTPLFIRGPLYSDGQLIIVLLVR